MVGDFRLVDDLVVFGRDAAALAADSHVAAGEDEAPKAGILGDLQHVSGAIDVGVEQRRRVLEPAAGVDDAVVDDIAAGHRLAQNVVVPDVPDEPRGLQVVDADRVGAVAHHHRDVLAVVDELARDVAAEVAVGADDEHRHRRPPNCFIQATASSGSVPSSSALWHHFTVADTNRSGL